VVELGRRGKEHSRILGRSSSYTEPDGIELSAQVDGLLENSTEQVENKIGEDSRTMAEQ